jgi:hypothetical protein
MRIVRYDIPHDLSRPRKIHPLIVRITHWINAVAIVIKTGGG